MTIKESVQWSQLFKQQQKQQHNFICTKQYYNIDERRHIKKKKEEYRLSQISPFTAKSNMLFFHFVSESCKYVHYVTQPYDNRYFLHNRKYHRECMLLNIFLETYPEMHAFAKMAKIPQKFGEYSYEVAKGSL